MKSISQIAKAAGCTYHEVEGIIKKEKLISSSHYGQMKKYKQTEIDKIFTILYFERKMNFITLESKMNDPNFDTPEVYSKDLAYERNMVIKC
jgi:hypothetical protein